jgi:hypothetical protein
VPQGSVTTLQIDRRAITAYHRGIAFYEHKQLISRRGMQSDRSAGLQPKSMDLGPAGEKTDGETDAAKSFFDFGGDVGQMDNPHEANSMRARARSYRRMPARRSSRDDWSGGWPVR